jgi:catechol 2,3-dioxygenase-like lactoylglutathione lyase family enzyme
MLCGIDHLVLTVHDVDASVRWYERVLGCAPVVFEDARGERRRALRIGDHTINLHAAGAPTAPHALHPTPGSADLCLRARLPLVEVERHVRREGAQVVLGPIWRVGARARLWSLYLRDPDGNLIEVANEVPVGEALPPGAPPPPQGIMPPRAPA